MKAKRSLIALNVLLAAILACNMPSAAPGSGQPQQPQQPQQQQPDLAGTITAQALYLIQASATPAFTDVPTLTPTTTLTPTPTVPQVSVTSATNCRTGPGTEYDLLYTLQPGQVAELVGKYSPLSYWVIKNPAGGICWLWGQYAVTSGNIANLPEYPPPPTPTPFVPATPSSLKVHFACTLNGPKLRYDIHVELTWQDNATNEDGYYVFRNDTLIATLGPNAGSFSDDTAQGTFVMAGADPSIVYSIQAFNSVAKSKQISKGNSCF